MGTWQGRPLELLLDELSRGNNAVQVDEFQSVMNLL